MQAHGRPVQVELQLSMETRVRPPQGTRHQRGPAPGRVGGGHHHLASPPLSAYTTPIRITSGSTGGGARRRLGDALSRCVPFRMVPTRLARRV
uniref:Uncharacterized protein n=1 Tax=Aegilops tauschii subsp. strangulata TaxID=200361 RepID=A0A453JVR6_AEGTS